MDLWGKFIHPITAHFRRRRGQVIQARFPDVASYRICDLGGSRHFWEKLGLAVPYAYITIYNVDTGTASGTSANSAHEIPIVLYDGRHIEVPDQHFDLLICNSVLEHVPKDQRQPLCREMLRVAKRVFVQTPSYWFPLEPHFIMPFVHWLPKSIAFPCIFVSPWRILARPSRKVIHDYFFETNLLTKGELKNLLPEARISSETFAGMTKSYYAVVGPGIR